MAQLDQITGERDDFKRSYEDLRKQRLNEFMTGFNIITNKLKENYQMLTLGGDAELELVDSLDPFSEGIMFRWDPGQTPPLGALLKVTQYTTGCEGDQPSRASSAITSGRVPMCDGWMSPACYSPLGRLAEGPIRGTSRWTRPPAMSEEAGFQNGL